MEVLLSDRLASGISIENSAQELVKAIKEGRENKGRRIDGNCDDGDNYRDLAPFVHLGTADGLNLSPKTCCRPLRAILKFCFSPNVSILDLMDMA